MWLHYTNTLLLKVGAHLKRFIIKQRTPRSAVSDSAQHVRRACHTRQQVQIIHVCAET